MKILVLGLNYAPEPIGVAVYTSGMAEALAVAGHEVQVVAGQPYYPAWKVMPGHNAFTFGHETRNDVGLIRVPHYIPARPTGARRLLHHLTFALAALFPMLWRALVWRPDVVVAIAPALLAAPVARMAAALCGARSWLHVQDFEVEAAFATGLLPDQGLLARLARRFEATILGSFDRVSSISAQMGRKLMDKNVPPQCISEFRNWADLDLVRPVQAPSPYRRTWAITTPHVALYSGNIANKQGIEIVIEAARLLKSRNDLTFVICGNGPNRARLEASAFDLSNVRFHDLQPGERLNDLLGLASLHLLPQISAAADLVLPSKLANMLASGRPTVATAEPGTGLYAEVKDCALVVRPDDVEGFAKNIALLCDDRELAHDLGRRARVRAERRWSKSAILDAFISQLLDPAAPDPEAAVEIAP